MATTKRGIVLMNLGSPDSTRVKDVRRYLNEFLMDERVIDMPYLKRLLLVKGIIVPFRAPKSAHAYSTIWTKEGSPLMVISKQLQEALQKQVTEPVALAMRYGAPAPWTAYDELLEKEPGLEEVVLVPLYPHYAMSSYETAVEYAKEAHKKGKYSFKLTIIPPFYDNALFLEALADSIKPYLQQPYDQIIFSYHGIPERHVQKTDPSGTHCLKAADCCNVSNEAHKFCYRHQILVTTKKVAEMLNIPAQKYSYAFQSRLGRDEWLKPYTAQRLTELPGEGIKKLLIVCPAFVSDCLETVEEIAIQGKESFMQAGGESFTLIPCLNVHPMWVKALAGWVREY
ncbi:ferrochelatase [Niastella koreensis]|uniref:Ferrochelatase n=2 Tax=Niastella koreensis TaxID=354356 RepID=G8TMG1_NIAKG|nr:ferrochelatase [Niastella koreensis]AEW01949.1 ferrochelatase [Niastella koreensis GR20-10]OQP48646.1 ferrochelatase [Niastella koreensis]